MPHATFDALLQGFGQLMGQPGLSAGTDGYLALTIDDQTVHLQYDADDDQVLLFTRLPPVALERAAEIYGLLLSANLFWIGTRGATFSIDPADGRVFLADQSPCQQLDPQALADWIEPFTNTALHWRERITTANAGGPLYPDDTPPCPDEQPAGRYH